MPIFNTSFTFLFNPFILPTESLIFMVSVIKYIIPFSLTKDSEIPNVSDICLTTCLVVPLND